MKPWLTTKKSTNITSLQFLATYLHLYIKQVTRKKYKNGAMVKHQSKFVVLKITSNVKGLFKTSATPLLSDFPAIILCTCMCNFCECIYQITVTVLSICNRCSCYSLWQILYYYQLITHFNLCTIGQQQHSPHLCYYWPYLYK